MEREKAILKSVAAWLVRLFAIPPDHLPRGGIGHLRLRAQHLAIVSDAENTSYVNLISLPPLPRKAQWSVFLPFAAGEQGYPPDFVPRKE